MIWSVRMPRRRPFNPHRFATFAKLLSHSPNGNGEQQGLSTDSQGGAQCLEVVEPTAKKLRREQVMTAPRTVIGQVSLIERQSLIEAQSPPRPAQNCLSSCCCRASEIHPLKQQTDASSTAFASQKPRRSSGHRAPKGSRNILHIIHGS